MTQGKQEVKIFNDKPSVKLFDKPRSKLTDVAHLEEVTIVTKTDVTCCTISLASLWN